jgi:small subunit ribosomal protein S9
LSEQATAQQVEKAPAREFIWGTGRRKTSVARIRLARGDGKMSVNGRDVEAFFNEDRDRNQVRAAFNATKTLGMYDCIATVAGGGFTGQAGAVSLGIARALSKIDDNFVPALRDAGLLTRDSRMKERKKYGLHGARRGTQFSKR